MSCKEEFIEIFKENITRPGADALLDYLTNKSDFFTAPASARYHGAYEGGLCEHSLNVYHCLADYLSRERVNELYGLEYTPETIALVALLHDVCKAGCYKKTFRNVKGEDGQWTKVPSYQFDDPLPYGHGEKSVYIVNGYLRLTREEAFAIRYHMGFSGNEDGQGQRGQGVSDVPPGLRPLRCRHGGDLFPGGGKLRASKEKKAFPSGEGEPLAAHQPPMVDEVDYLRTLSIKRAPPPGRGGASYVLNACRIVPKDSPC